MKAFERVRYPVVFHTEQGEGRNSKPYVDYKDLDLCRECMDKVLRIDGYGAQGHNKYSFKKVRV